MDAITAQQTALIRSKYRDLLEDVQFDQLEIGLRVPNIFAILGMTRNEIRHSNFLGWLMDPNGSHGWGKLFINHFVRRILSTANDSPLDEVARERLDFEKAVVLREWRNIDILLIIEKVVICIENKIDSRDGKGQLDKYATIIEEDYPASDFTQVFVYLTPDGDLPRNQVVSNYATCSYTAIIDILDRLLVLHQQSMGPSSRLYISDYLITLKREITMSDELNRLARDLYKNHSELFKFILKHRTSAEEEVHPLFVAKFKEWGYKANTGSQNKGFARFLTSELDELIPRKGKGIAGKESFVFEVDFYGDKKYTLFKAMIADGDAKVSKQLAEWLRVIPGARQVTAEKWITYFQVRWEFDKEELRDDPAKINAILDSQKTKIQEVVTKVEAELLKHRSELALL